MATWQDAVGNRPATAARPYSPVLGIVLLVAGALLAIGSLLNWVTVTVNVNGPIPIPFLPFSPNVNLPPISHSVKGTGLPHGSFILAAGIVIAGAGALMLLFRGSRGIRIALGVVAVAAVGVVVWVLLGALGQRHQLQAVQDSLKKIADSGSPLGFLLKQVEKALKGAVHLKITKGAGLYLAAAGFLAAAVGAIAAIVTGLLRRPEPAAAPAVGFVPPVGYAPPAGFGGQPAYPPPAWATPPQAPAPVPAPAPSSPAAWPPGPGAPPGPPPVPPPMPGRGSHAPTVIGGPASPAPPPPLPTVAEQQASDPNRLPPPRRRAEPPDQQR